MPALRRRHFITLLGGAAAWPLAARAQQDRRPRRIAALMGTVETAPDAVGLRAMLDRLKTLGWTEGITARIDIRWSKSDLGLMRENAQALLALSPDVILCHSNPALAQLRPLAGNTPIVFVMVADPVGSGFINNLAHPGGNITGFTKTLTIDGPSGAGLRAIYETAALAPPHRVTAHALALFRTPGNFRLKRRGVRL